MGPAGEAEGYGDVALDAQRPLKLSATSADEMPYQCTEPDRVAKCAGARPEHDHHSTR